MRLLVVLLVLLGSLSIISGWPQNASPQEPHYRNGEHNSKYHKQKASTEYIREDDGGDAENDVDRKAANCPIVGEGGCPYLKHGELKATDCPSFKDGCPYSADDEAMEKLKDCPAFKEGCPYKEGENVDASLSDCPAFQQGCPYHHHHHLSGCPVLKSSKCPYFKGEEDFKKIANCPKFKEGCPYSEDQDMLEGIQNCPKFKDGCPFATDEHVDLTHWKDCPAFKDGCPYDSVVEHGHLHEEKKIAKQVLNAVFGIGSEDLSPFLSENFQGHLKGEASSTYGKGSLDKKLFLEYASNLKKLIQSTSVSVVSEIGEGHTVVIQSSLSGQFQDASKTTNEEYRALFKGIQNKELKEIDLVHIFHFDHDNKIERLTSFFDLKSFSAQLGL